MAMNMALFRRSSGLSRAHMRSPTFSLARALSTKIESYPTKKMEGEKAPAIGLMGRKNNDWHKFCTEALFKDKKVVLFALPGAFTPTCSSTHLPGYEEKYDELKKLGVDEVACLSVNDGFVMNAWGKNLGIQKVTLLPDGNGEFTRAMGMVSDKSAIGFGPRSWRYSMFVDHGIIKKIFAEPVKEGDPFEVSDVNTMLAYLKVNK